MGLPTVGSCEIAVLHSECFPVETGNSLEKFLQFPLFLTKLNFPGRLRQGSFEWVGARACFQTLGGRSIRTQNLGL